MDRLTKKRLSTSVTDSQKTTSLGSDVVLLS